MVIWYDPMDHGCYTLWLFKLRGCGIEWSNFVKSLKKWVENRWQNLFLKFFNENNRWFLDHNLGFHSCQTQTKFLWEFVTLFKTWVKKCYHVGILESDNLWTLASNVKKGWEVESRFWFSFVFLVWLVEMDGLSTFRHSVKWP